MDYRKWTEDALLKVSQNIKIGEVFILKDLFEGCVWATLNKGEPSAFGRYFSNEVNEVRIDSVVYAGKNQRGYNQYQRVK